MTNSAMTQSIPVEEAEKALIHKGNGWTISAAELERLHHLPIGTPLSLEDATAASKSAYTISAQATRIETLEEALREIAEMQPFKTYSQDAVMRTHEHSVLDAEAVKSRADTAIGAS